MNYEIINSTSQSIASFNQPQICIVRTRKGELIKSVFTQSQQLQLFVKLSGNLNDNDWKVIKNHDLPSELLRPLSFNKVKTLLEGTYLKVSQYTNGDLRLEMNVGLLGGMMQRGDIKNQLKNIEGHTQLANALDRAQQIIPRGITTVGNAARSTGAVVVGGGLGAGAGYALFALGLTPWGWAAVIGVGVGIALTSILWWCKNNYSNKHQKTAQKIAKDFQEMVDDFAKIQKLIEEKKSKKHSEVAKSSKSFLNKIITQNYIKRWDQFNFELNEKKFDEIKQYYDSDTRQQIVITIKFIILCCVACIPNDDRPTDKLITLLQNISTKTNEKSMKNYTMLVIATLYFESNRYNSCIEMLEKVDKDSDLKEFANDFSNEVKEFMKSQQQQIEG